MGSKRFPEYDQTSGGISTATRSQLYGHLCEITRRAIHPEITDAIIPRNLISSVLIAVIAAASKSEEVEDIIGELIRRAKLHDTKKGT